MRRWQWGYSIFINNSIHEPSTIWVWVDSFSLMIILDFLFIGLGLFSVDCRLWFSLIFSLISCWFFVWFSIYFLVGLLCVVMVVVLGCGGGWVVLGRDCGWRLISCALRWRDQERDSEMKKKKMGLTGEVDTVIVTVYIYMVIVIILHMNSIIDSLMREVFE